MPLFFFRMMRSINFFHTFFSVVIVVTSCAHCLFMERIRKYQLFVIPIETLPSLPGYPGLLHQRNDDPYKSFTFPLCSLSPYLFLFSAPILLTWYILFFSSLQVLPLRAISTSIITFCKFRSRVIIIFLIHNQVDPSDLFPSTLSLQYSFPLY